MHGAFGGSGPLSVKDPAAQGGKRVLSNSFTPKTFHGFSSRAELDAWLGENGHGDPLRPGGRAEWPTATPSYERGVLAQCGIIGQTAFIHEAEA